MRSSIDIKIQATLIWLIGKRNNLNKDLRKYLILNCLLLEYNSYTPDTVNPAFTSLDMIFRKIEKNKDRYSLMIINRLDYIKIGRDAMGCIPQ